jgi:hypothetical protein
MYCTGCGSPVARGDRYCPTCGSAIVSAPGNRSASNGVTETSPPAAVDLQPKIRPPEGLWSSLREPPARSVPPRLWTVIVLLALVGVVIVVPTLFLLVDSLALFSFGNGFDTAFGVFVMVLLLVPLVFGLGCLYLARRIQQGDRVARVLAIVLCLSAAAACLLTGARDLGWVLAGLLALGTAAMLGLDPVVRSHFTGEDARYGAEPSGVVAARALMVVVAAGMLLVGVLFLPLAAYEPSLAVYGVLEVVIALGVFYLSRRLAAGDTTARVLATGLALVYLMDAIVAGHGEPGVILPVALALCVIGLLWLPDSSRRYFAGLPRPSQPVVATVERAIDFAVAGAATAVRGARGEGGSGR